MSDLRSVEELSPQQRGTLELLAEGLGNVQIAQRYHTSLESLGAMLDELYNAIGITPDLSKQQKREAAIAYYKKSAGAQDISAAFDTKTPANLFEGFSPWQRQVLTRFAEDTQLEEIAAQERIGLGAVEECIAQFTTKVKATTPEIAKERLRRALVGLGQITPERGHQLRNGHDKEAHMPADQTLTNAQPPPAPTSTVPVSERELRILELIEEGKTNDEIGTRVDISMGYVNTTISGLYARFGLGNMGGSRIEKRKLLIKFWHASQAGVQPDAEAAPILLCDCRSAECSGAPEPVVPSVAGIEGQVAAAEPLALPTTAEQKKTFDYQRTRELVIRTQQASLSFLQKELGIGGPPLREILRQLEEEGVLGKPGSGRRKGRQVLIAPPQGAGELTPAPTAIRTRRRGGASGAKFSDEEKVAKLQQLLAAVGEDSRMGQMLAEIIGDIGRMEKMRQVMQILKEE